MATWESGPHPKGKIQRGNSLQLWHLLAVWLGAREYLLSPHPIKSLNIKPVKSCSPGISSGTFWPNALSVSAGQGSSPLWWPEPSQDSSALALRWAPGGSTLYFCFLPSSPTSSHPFLGGSCHASRGQEVLSRTRVSSVVVRSHLLVMSMTVIPSSRWWARPLCQAPCWAPAHVGPQWSPTAILLSGLSSPLLKMMHSTEKTLWESGARLTLMWFSPLANLPNFSMVNTV